MMRLLSFFFSCSILFLFFLCNLLHSQPWGVSIEQKRGFVGFSFGYHRVNLNDYNDSLQSLEDVYSPNYEIGRFSHNMWDGDFHIGYERNNFAGILAMGFFSKLRVDSLWSDGSKGSNSILCSYLEGTGKYSFRVSIAQKLVPFAGAGIGLYFVEWSFYDDHIPMLDINTVEPIYNGGGTTFGFHIISGIEYFISRKFSICLTLKYIFAKVGRISVEAIEGESIPVCFAGEKTTIDLGGFTPRIEINMNLEKEVKYRKYKHKRRYKYRRKKKKEKRLEEIKFEEIE